MAKLVGVWIFAWPRKVTDDAELQGGATLILTEADKQKLGDGFMTVHIRVYDWDRWSADDLVQSDDTFQLGPANLNVGPNTFGINALVKHAKLKAADPSSQDTAELYFRLRVASSAAGVQTSWANSPNENVKYA
jgi:hypothetical protein